jgi:LmbE family N-acetylglucosaminyl deacetylase
MVLAPHADDESLGCGGLLSRFRSSFEARGEPHTSLVLCSNSDVTVHHGLSHRFVAATERRKEFEAVAWQLAASTCFLTFKTRHLRDEPSLLVQTLEHVIEGERPSVLLIPGPSFHEDHTAVYRAAVAALRPRHCRSVRLVLAYETPYYAWAAQGDTFVPDVFVRLSTAELEAKKRLCAFYTSQRLDTPDGQEAVERLARRRGAELEPVPHPSELDAGPPLAEAYSLVRCVLN